jgi:hypothetical protein
MFIDSPTTNCASSVKEPDVVIDVTEPRAVATGSNAQLTQRPRAQESGRYRSRFCIVRG